jgi:hypothetical protein
VHLRRDAITNRDKSRTLDRTSMVTQVPSMPYLGR